MQQTFFEAFNKIKIKASRAKSKERTKDRLVDINQNEESPEEIRQYYSLNCSPE